jgi:pilus assembly protein CpaB
VEVNEFSAVAGFVEPGARVDLIETFVSNGNQLARTIAQNVKIQAVNHRLSAVPADPAAPPQSTTSVTLLVSPATAQLIQLAASTGRPHLALRGLDDEDVNELTEVTGSQLRGQSDLQTTVAPAEPVPVQSVIDSTTRPAASPAPASAAPTTRPTQRIVQIIRAGVPSEIRMQIPVVREPSQMTETDQNF